MSQLRKKSSKNVVRVIAFVMAFAMVATSLSYTPASAAKKAKVKSVKLTPGTKYLVLKKGKSKKLKVTVKATPSKAKNKKVTWKSSKPKVVKVSKKGVVKALKKGFAKITVTSKLNKKKKASIIVKVGTPVTKVKLNKTSASLQWSSGNADKLQLKATVTPKKPTVKGVTWKSSLKRVAKVSSKGLVTALSVGTTKITATAKDGTGKKATCKVKVSLRAATPAPTAPPDNNAYTMVEDFESYPVGTKWSRYTTNEDKGKTYDCGSMTVVQEQQSIESSLKW